MAVLDAADWLWPEPQTEMGQPPDGVLAPIGERSPRDGNHVSSPTGKEHEVDTLDNAILVTAAGYYKELEQELLGLTGNGRLRMSERVRARLDGASIGAPVGRALLGHGPGALVDVVTPRKQFSLEVLSVRHADSVEEAA